MRQPAVKAKPAAARVPKERTKGTLVKPDYVLKLMDKSALGPAELARLIGISPGTLFKAREAGLISMPFEVAAKGIWFEKGFDAVDNTQPARRTTDLSQAVPSPTSDAVSLLLIQVPRDRAPMLQRAAEMMGALVLSHD
jgi:hypothetical protein